MKVIIGSIEDNNKEIAIVASVSNEENGAMRYLITNLEGEPLLRPNTDSLFWKATDFISEAYLDFEIKHYITCIHKLEGKIAELSEEVLVKNKKQKSKVIELKSLIEVLNKYKSTLDKCRNLSLLFVDTKEAFLIKQAKALLIEQLNGEEALDFAERVLAIAQTDEDEKLVDFVTFLDAEIDVKRETIKSQIEGSDKAIVFDFSELYNFGLDNDLFNESYPLEFYLERDFYRVSEAMQLLFLEQVAYFSATSKEDVAKAVSLSLFEVVPTSTENNNYNFPTKDKYQELEELVAIHEDTSGFSEEDLALMPSVSIEYYPQSELS